MINVNSIAIGSVIQQILSGVIFVILTQNLGADKYGVITIMVALVATIYRFSCSWIAPYMVKSGAKHFYKYENIGDSYVKSAIASLLLSCIGIYIIIALENYSFVTIYGGVNLLILLLAGSLLMNIFRIGLQSVQAFRAYGISLWIDKALYFVLMMILFYVGSFDSISVLYALAIATLIIGFWGVLYYLRVYVSLQSDSFIFKEFSKMSIPILFATVAAYFCSPPFASLFVGNISSLKNTGWIGVAFIIAGFLLQPIQWITPTLLPKFTIAVEEENQDTLNNHISKIVLPLASLYGMFIIVFIYLVISTPIISYIIGKDFHEGIPTIILIISPIAGEVIHLLVVSMLYARGQESMVLVSTIMRGSFFLAIALLFRNYEMILFALLLVPWLGAAVEILALRDLFKAGLNMRFLLLFVVSIMPGISTLFGNIYLTIISCIIAFFVIGLILFEQRNEVLFILKQFMPHRNTIDANSNV